MKAVLWLAFTKTALLVPLTKLGLHLRLALVKCSGLVRTKFKLRLWLAFTKCSTQKGAYPLG